MNSKVIAGFLILSPIVAFVMMMSGVMPNTSDMTIAQSLEKMLENKTQNMNAMLVITVAISSLVLGHALLARSMRGNGQPAATCAELAGIILLLVIPVLLVQLGYFWEAMEKAETDKMLAEAILTNGEGVGEIIGIPWTIGFFLMGIAIIRQKKFHIVVGVIAVALPVLGFVGEVGGDSDAIELLQFVGFIGMVLLTVTMGVLTLIRKEG